MAVKYDIPHINYCVKIISTEHSNWQAGDSAELTRRSQLARNAGEVHGELSQHVIDTCWN